MSNSKRISGSFTSGSWTPESSILNIPSLESSNSDAEEWIQHWQGVYARDLVDSRIVTVDEQTSVEEACDRLLSEDALCLAVKSAENQETPGTEGESGSLVGLFDFSDVNAFLTLAATRHTLPPEELKGNPRADEIVTAARAGRVTVRLVSNLSEKNPLQTLPYDATVISLLEVFSKGTHRALIHSASPSTDFLGMVSDRGLLAWFASYAKETPSFQQFLSNPLHSLSLPSINIYDSVVAATSTSTVLDAMKLMSDEGVSSIAVIDDETGTLLSAVSVTDIGKIVVPSESNHILSAPLHQFISHIKGPDGSTDGVDRYPVYSVFPTSVLSYTVQKLLATNAHRLFVTRDPSGASSPGPSPSSSGNLSGIVSIVDILSLFARLAKIPNVDPTQMQRHRRTSSASSHSSKSDLDLVRSRSSSRTSIRRSPSLRTNENISAHKSITNLSLDPGPDRTRKEA